MADNVIEMPLRPDAGPTRTVTPEDHDLSVRQYLDQRCECGKIRAQHGAMGECGHFTLAAK